MQASAAYSSSDKGNRLTLAQSASYCLLYMLQVGEEHKHSFCVCLQY